LVEKCFGLRVPGNGSINLLAGHAGFDVRVIGNALQCYVRDDLVHEPLVQVSQGSRSLGIDGFPVSLGLLLAAFIGIREQEVRKSCSHQPCAGQGESHAGGVDRDPPSAPLFRNVCRGSAATSWVENEIAWISGHEDTTFDDFYVGLDNVNFGICVSTCCGISP